VAMAPAVIAGDVAPAGAALLGDLLDGRASAEFARGSLRRREGSGLRRDGRMASKPVSAATMMRRSASIAPPEAVCPATENAPL
jgi:hypothetical protein